ncbi:MAG: hypothetical protein ACK40G_08075 [Cytophagaceae bacterium]
MILNKIKSIIFSALFFSSPLLAQDNLYIYSDQIDRGAPSGRMGAAGGSSLDINPNSTENPLKGKFCLNVSATGAEAWCGVFIQEGGTWKEGVPADKELANLTPYRYLVFHARSDKNYTIAKLGMGEGKEGNKDEGKIPLTTEWKRFVFELPGGEDRSRVNGLFLIVFEGAGNVFFDEIYYAGPEFKKETTDIVYGSRSEALDPNSFYVYSDKFDNGVPSGMMGEKNGKSLTIDDNWRENCYIGPKCIKVTVAKGVETWRGIHIQYASAWNESITPATNLPDLSEYDRLEFFARTDKETYLISEIGMGAGGVFEEKKYDSFIEVGPKWRKYTINLKGVDKKRVNTVLYMVLTEGTFYLDEIRYIKKQPK